MERVQKFIIRIIETHITNKTLKKISFLHQRKIFKNYKFTKNVSIMRLWHIALQETD